VLVVFDPLDMVSGHRGLGINLQNAYFGADLTWPFCCLIARYVCRFLTTGIIEALNGLSGKRL